ncbi:hypothetical protein [Aeromonas veronii]|uniref:Helix-turn-helix type 11 domain-containing protein n=2 Tax=Aeromonas TaxID=642 RepID=A0A3A9ICQ4_AERVE|nr:hypothetical protein D6R50_24665 [Aeromonas veronii]RKJ86483.1 hypothetical protein D6R50_18450 [Aeromonas veronii]
MSTNPKPPLPRYLQVAHWLHDQQRAISAREAADVFGVSSWSIERDFARVRGLSGIVVFDEQRVPSKGGQQYLLRVLQIFPYWLDEHQQPHQQLASSWDLNAPLTWRDLLCRPWCQLVARHQRSIDA